MEVIEVAEDKFWLHEGGSVPPGAEDYDGPPPIPLDQVRRDLPAGWTAVLPTQTEEGTLVRVR